MLVQKEKSVGNPNGKHLCAREIHREFRDRDRRERDTFFMDRPQERLFNVYREIIRDRKHSFIVIEIETPVADLRKFADVASYNGKYHVFLIEVMQPDDIIKKYATNKKDNAEALQDIENMKKPPPREITLIDPILLYEKDMMVERVNSIIDRYLYRNDYSISTHRPDYDAMRQDTIPNPLRSVALPESDDKAHIKELLKNQDFVNLVQSDFLNLKINPKSIESKTKTKDEEFDELLKKTRNYNLRLHTDYNHITKQDEYENVKGFRADKIYDYTHLTTEKLTELKSKVKIDDKLNKMDYE
jgi:hypothetical protein